MTQHYYNPDQKKNRVLTDAHQFIGWLNKFSDNHSALPITEDFTIQSDRNKLHSKQQHEKFRCADNIHCDCQSNK